MEATAAASTTGSQTIADLIPQRGRASMPSTSAMRYKRDGSWHDVTYAQLAEIVQEIGLGLIDLGIAAGRAACASSPTPAPSGPTRTWPPPRAGAVVVPIYQTNSPEECLWVISDSDACAIVVRGRGAARQDRRDPRPDPEPAHRDRDRPARRRRSSNGSGSAGRGARRDHARAGARARARAPARGARGPPRRRRPEDPFTFIYTSGTTGPPKGCVLTHGNYRAMIDMIERGRRDPERRGHLPVPPARPLLRAADPAADVRPRRHARVLRRRHQADRPRAARGQTDATCRRCRACSRRSTRSPTARSRRSRRRSASSAEQAIELGREGPRR